MNGYRNMDISKSCLVRAGEFERMGRKELALEELNKALKPGKNNSWQKIHETIVDRFISLCVELKNCNVAKEGLYQYRRLCQKICGSFDKTLIKYLQLAEEKLEIAAKNSQLTAEEIEFLDEEFTVEEILMGGGSTAQERNDRMTLAPWIRFTWESYKQCLDLIRGDLQRQSLYKEIALKGIQFCTKYNRRMDLKRLGDILRNHWASNKERSPEFCDPDIQNQHLEIRHAFFNSSVQMEFWQEAFRSAEDFFALFKRHPKPVLLASYYQKLVPALFKTGEYLFHACALQRLFVLYRNQKKNITESELQEMASQVVCATLAIPLTKARNCLLPIDEIESENKKKLAALLSCKSIPTRSSLVDDLVKYNIIQHVCPELKKLYSVLEVEFQPLDLPTNSHAHLEFVMSKEGLRQYGQKLRDITVIKFIQQVSEVFETIELSHLNSMIPFVDALELQRYLICAGMDLSLDVKVVHETESLIFGSRLDVDKGLDQMAFMAETLMRSLDIIHKETIEKEKEQLRLDAVKSYTKTCQKDHERILMRKHIIENMKLEKENAEAQEEKQKRTKEEEERKHKIEAETARLAKQTEERQKQKMIDEQREIQKKIVKDKVAQIKNTAIGAKALADVDEEALENMNVEDVIAKQVQQLEKEKKEREDKLRTQERNVDFYERAKRLEEIPLLLKNCEEFKDADKAHWEELEKERVDELLAERKHASETKKRLVGLSEDVQEFKDKVYNEKLAIYEKMISEERVKLLLERKKIRKEERRNQWVKEKEEKIQREKEREAQAKKEQQEREEQEKLRQLNLQAEKQRQRELEIEERERQKREADKPAPAQKYVPPRGNSRWSKPADSERDGNNAKPADGWRAPRNDDASRGEDRRRNNEVPSNNDGWRTKGNNNSTRPSINSQKKDEPKKSDEGGSWRRR